VILSTFSHFLIEWQKPTVTFTLFVIVSYTVTFTFLVIYDSEIIVVG
jgi:hypothetical protein